MVLWIVFCGEICNKVVIVVLRGLCQVISTWKGWVGLLRRVLCLISKVGLTNVSRRVGIYLGCQLLGSPFLVLPSKVGHLTEPLIWSLLYERRPMSQLGRAFVLVVRKDFCCITELKPSLILVPAGQGHTQATLPRHC